MRKGQKVEQYKGFRSKNAWNVSMWLACDPAYTEICQRMIEKYPHRLDVAAKVICRDFLPTKTPDNARYNRLSVLEFLKGLKNEN